jgi:hypothetical protein
VPGSFQRSRRPLRAALPNRAGVRTAYELPRSGGKHDPSHPPTMGVPGVFEVLRQIRLPAWIEGLRQVPRFALNRRVNAETRVTDEHRATVLAFQCVGLDALLAEGAGSPMGRAAVSEPQYLHLTASALMPSLQYGQSLLMSVISQPSSRSPTTFCPDRRTSRRSTPQRIDEARHAATHNRLIGEGATAATADAWIAAWDAKAAQDSLERGSASLSSSP